MMRLKRFCGALLVAGVLGGAFPPTLNSTVMGTNWFWCQYDLEEGHHVDYDKDTDPEDLPGGANPFWKAMPPDGMHGDEVQIGTICLGEGAEQHSLVES